MMLAFVNIDCKSSLRSNCEKIHEQESQKMLFGKNNEITVLSKYIGHQN